MNKRDFIVGACTGVAAGVGHAGDGGKPPATAAATAGAQTPSRLARRPDLLANPGLAQWQRYAGDRFLIPQAGHQLVLRAVEQQHAHLPGEQFTLMFTSAAADAHWHGGFTTVAHKATGQQLPLFLQDAGRDVAGNSLWRAAFSRRV